MKKLMIMLLVFVMVESVIGATLLDSEDFQSYSVDSDILADSHWYCSSPPSCASIAGGAMADFNLVTNGTNKYLNIYASGYTPGVDTATITLYRNSSGFTTFSDTDKYYTLQFRMRGYATYNAGWGGNMPNVVARIGESYWNGATNTGFNIPSSSRTNGFVLGQYYNGSVPTLALWDLLRIAYYTVPTQPYSYPHTIDCNISDNEWHTITKVYKFENFGAGVNNLTQIRVYQDSDLCYEQNLSSGAFGSNMYPFSALNFDVWNSATMSIDDINFYEGEVNGTTYQCSDSVDNDGDGYIDYPSDPSCTSSTDNTESPYDYTQCNNGIDDDVDGYIDLADPQCSDLTDTSEYPADTSSQPENECLVYNFCLLREYFPYSDNPFLHDWYGTRADFRVVNIYGSNKMLYDNDGTDDFNLSINITHPNIYNDINIRIELFPELGDEWVGYDNYTWYLNLKDPEDRTAIRLKFDHYRYSASVPDSIKVRVSNNNGTGWEEIATLTPGFDENSRIIFDIKSDQILKSFRLNYEYNGNLVQGTTDYDWYDVIASKVYTFNIEDDDYNSDRMQTHIDNILITGTDVDYDTVCDEWELPYYLVESFNGYISLCGWSTSHYLFSAGQLQITDDVSPYSQQKTFDLAEASKSRYVTLTFDMNIQGVRTGSTATLRMYDSENSNVFTLWFQDTGDYLWYNEYGEGKVASNITLNSTSSYKIIFDFQDDQYDIYKDGISLINNSGLTQRFYNLEDLESIKVTAYDSNLTLDNIKVYASDKNGNLFMPDEDLVSEIQNETTVCGLFYKYDSECTSDEDCITGYCRIDGKCSRFDYNYCDDNGLSRGNWCYISGVTSCGLNNLGDIILVKFWLFLIFLILLMGLAYVIIIMRRD